MKLLSGVLLVLLVFLTGVASGEFYHYTDSNGELHYVDDISLVPKKYRKQARSVEPEGNVSGMDATPAPRAPRGQLAQKASERQQVTPEGPAVEVFMTSWCGYCRKMVRFLDEKGIPYTAHDIEKDSDAARTYRELGGSGVPVVRVGSHVIHGYNPDELMRYYSGGK